MLVTHENINEVVVHATITDWMGNILHEAHGKDSYDKMLDVYFLYEEESADIYINSYDKEGNNYGIMV